VKLLYTTDSKCVVQGGDGFQFSDPLRVKQMLSDAVPEIESRPFRHLLNNNSFGSAPAWGAGGRRFKSCRPDHSNPYVVRATDNLQIL